MAELGYAETNTEKKKRKSKHGILIGSKENLLTWKQEEIMFSYMKRYYLAIVLAPKAQGWRIRQHFQNDGVYENLMRTCPASLL